MPNTRKTPADALEELRLGKKAFSYFYSPLNCLKALCTTVEPLLYIDAYNAKYPQAKTTIVETLSRTFEDPNLANVLSRAKHNAKIRTIATEVEAAQLDTLASRFKGRSLNQIFQIAKKYPTMENSAVAIQTAKMETYLASNQSPRGVFNMLGLDGGNSILGDPCSRSGWSMSRISTRPPPPPRRILVRDVPFPLSERQSRYKEWDEQSKHKTNGRSSRGDVGQVLAQSQGGPHLHVPFPGSLRNSRSTF